jgi:EmrB/QacA subfamily drug resistance transporter
MDRKWWTLIAVCTGVFMLLLDITIVNVALPDIETAFKANLSDLQWVIDAYALTLAALLLTAGSLADLFGRRIVFATGIVIFTAGSILCGVAQSATMLSLSRGFQGIGGAIMFATALALLAQAFPPQERPVAFAAFGAVTGVAVAVGPVLGGALTSGLSWRWIFFVNVPVGVFALGVTLSKVEESKLPGAPKPDVPGFATFSLSLAGLVYGLIRSQLDGWTSAHVIIPLAIAVVLMAAFVLIELRSAQPMLDLGLLRVPTFNGGLIAAFAVSASIFSLFTYLTIFIQQILGYSAIAAGIRFLPLTGLIFVTSVTAGRLLNRIQTRFLIAGGFALVTAGLFFMRGLTPTDGWTHFLPGFLLAGAGVGLISPPLASTAVGVVSRERAGMASGINSTFRQVGIATGVAALGSILASLVKSHVIASLAGTPLAAHGAQLGAAVGSGSLADAARAVPARYQHLVFAAGRASYVHALNEILLIAGIIAAAATLATLLLIRQKDFHPVGAGAPPSSDEPEMVTA